MTQLTTSSLSNSHLNAKSTVWIIDDDASVVRVTHAMLEASGDYEITSFTESEALLAALEFGNVDCVIADLIMPNIGGVELQRRISEVDKSLSIVFFSGKADVPTTVQLMRAGAVTLLEKPYDPEDLFNAVRTAIDRTHEQRAKLIEVQDTISRSKELSAEEKDVMAYMVAGVSNKSTANQLKLSSRTLDRRRQRVLRVMGVESATELAAKIERCRIHLPGSLDK